MKSRSDSGFTPADIHDSENSSRSISTLRWGSLARIVVVSLGAIVVLRTFVVSLCLVPSVSMEPSILRGDYTVVYTLAQSAARACNAARRLFGLPQSVTERQALQRGSVVAFHLQHSDTSNDNAELFVKRIVGCPGDTVYVDQSITALGAAALRKVSEHDTAQPYQHMFEGLVTVPHLGQSIELSSESVERWKTIIVGEGNVVSTRRGIVYINGNSTPNYVLQHDYYYVLGDNRSDSYDSRYWGFVRDDDIVGTPLFVYWSSELDSVGAATRTRIERIGTVIH